MDVGRALAIGGSWAAVHTVLLEAVDRSGRANVWRYAADASWFGSYAVGLGLMGAALLGAGGSSRGTLAATGAAIFLMPSIAMAGYSAFFRLDGNPRPLEPAKNLAERFARRDTKGSVFS